jgi:hypothetical protein
LSQSSPKGSHVTNQISSTQISLLLKAGIVALPWFRNSQNTIAEGSIEYDLNHLTTINDLTIFLPQLDAGGSIR